MAAKKLDKMIDQKSKIDNLVFAAPIAVQPPPVNTINRTYITCKHKWN